MSDDSTVPNDPTDARPLAPPADLGSVPVDPVAPAPTVEVAPPAAPTAAWSPDSDLHGTAPSPAAAPEAPTWPAAPLASEPATDVLPAAPAPSWSSPLPPTPPSAPPLPPTPPSAPPLPPTPPSAPTAAWGPEASPPAAPVVTRAPRWVVPFAVLAALALFVGGALTGWAIADRDATSDATSPVADDGSTNQVSAPIDPPVADGSTEPVAAVAAAVAPSVVQIETNTGLGSGIVYDDDGHILTAAHVIDGADQVRVRLADGTLVAAEIVGTNAATDVGVVAIDPPDGLEPAVLGIDAEIEVGQLAVAVGSPFGLDQTVTSGVVSALDRPVETEGTSIVGMIQTDASINPGNSGGALADRYGRIIGINDAIRTSGGGNEGVGFAIPIGLAVRVADQLIAGEEIQAGLLGVTVSDPTDGPPGALVGEVMPGTPAAASGLEVGDLITAVDGGPITRTQSLRAEILARAPGTEVVVQVLRDGRSLEIEVTLASATD